MVPCSNQLLIFLRQALSLNWERNNLARMSDKSLDPPASLSLHGNTDTHYCMQHFTLVQRIRTQVLMFEQQAKHLPSP